MKVFLTGASGFVGSHTTNRLIERGHQPVCLVRKTSQISRLQNLGVDLVFGDTTSPDSLLEGMGRCDSVINLANLYSWWESDPRLYQQTNIEGTRHVMEAALRLKMAKVIHLSSAVIWGVTQSVPFWENSPIGVHQSRYACSKYLGDCQAWTLYKSAGLPLVVLYPSGILGPGDSKASGEYIYRLLRRRMPARVLENSILTWVHVSDVATAIVAALEKEGNIGEKYLIGKEQLSLGQLNSLVAQISGIPLPLLRMPNFAVRIAAVLATFVANITGRPPILGLARDLVSFMLEGMHFEGSKAERELGLNYTPIRRAVEEAIHGYGF